MRRTCAGRPGIGPFPAPRRPGSVEPEEFRAISRNFEQVRGSSRKFRRKILIRAAAPAFSPRPGPPQRRLAGTGARQKAGQRTNPGIRPKDCPPRAPCHPGLGLQARPPEQAGLGDTPRARARARHWAGRRFFVGPGPAGSAPGPVTARTCLRSAAVGRSESPARCGGTRSGAGAASPYCGAASGAAMRRNSDWIHCIESPQ